MKQDWTWVLARPLLQHRCVRFPILLLVLVPLQASALPFFKVTLDGKASYFLGTQHQPYRPEVIPLEIFYYMDQSRAVYFESNRLANVEDAVRLEAFQGRELGRDLKQFYTNDEWLRLKRVLETEGLPSFQFTALTPNLAFYVMNVVFERAESRILAQAVKAIYRLRPDLEHREYVNFEMQQRLLLVDNNGAALTDSLDEQLRNHILQNPKVYVGALESGWTPVEVTERDLKEAVRYRLKRLRGLKAASQSDFIKYMEEASNLKDGTTMYLTWRPGQSLHEKINYTPPWYSEDRSPGSRAIIGRHRHWWPKILQELKTGNVFVAVGVAHVLDDDGLIALAKADGATVEFVDLPVPCESLLSPRSN